VRGSHPTADPSDQSIDKAEPTSSSVVEATRGLRFGRSLVSAVIGEPVDQPVEAVVYAANVRGVLGAGATGSIRLLAGEVVERDAMARAPLPLGGAIVTGAGHLADRGILAVIHAVVTPTLGEPPHLDSVRLAIGAALLAADARRLRSLALPLVSAVGRDSAPLTVAIIAGATTEEIVGHLRRSVSRLERIVITVRFDDHVAAVNAALATARARLWTSQ